MIRFLVGTILSIVAFWMLLFTYAFFLDVRKNAEMRQQSVSGKVRP